MIRSWSEAVEADYPPRGLVTEQTVRSALSQRRWLRGSIRVAMGRILTDARRAARRQQAKKRRF